MSYECIQYFTVSTFNVKAQFTKLHNFSVYAFIKQYCNKIYFNPLYLNKIIPKFANREIVDNMGNMSKYIHIYGYMYIVFLVTYYDTYT